MKRTKIRFENSKIKTIIVLALIVALGISAMVGTYQVLLSNARTMGMDWFGVTVQMKNAI